MAPEGHLQGTSFSGGAKHSTPMPMFPFPSTEWAFPSLAALPLAMPVLLSGPQLVHTSAVRLSRTALGRPGASGRYLYI